MLDQKNIFIVNKLELAGVAIRGLQMSVDPEGRQCMCRADECIRLAGLTDDIHVRDQLVELAQGWILASQRERHAGEVITLYPLRG